ncbi:nociceptin receptor-like [Patiria miniata]|uniref:G-protein coupled receptors family 1 profile domain-containing protein n=1 Tax=Patiria miniata TaxID=46514 RepID=A0A914BGY0_PATMI|nr:nociceptin receptor-like [Patiria miniata]
MGDGSLPTTEPLLLTTPAVLTGTIEPGDGDEGGGSQPSERFEVPFLFVVFVLGVVGNFFVLVVYSRKRYRRSNAALYILNLALGDMLALTVVLFHITEFFKVTWPTLWRTDLQCKVHRYFRFVAFDLTVFNMVAIAIDRYFAVVHPLRFRLMFTARRTKVICVVIWVLAFMAAIPTPFMFKAIYNNDTSLGTVTYTGKLPFACKVITPFGPWWPEFKSIYLNIVLFYVPTILTAVIYVIIIVTIKRTIRPLKKTTNGRSADAANVSLHQRFNSWKSARTLLVVFVAYVVCYGFFATYNVLFRYAKGLSVPPELYNLALLLPFANSCMNPIIYSFITASFRKACRELLCRRGRRTDRFCRDTASRDDALGQPVVLKLKAMNTDNYSNSVSFF